MVTAVVEVEGANPGDKIELSQLFPVFGVTSSASAISLFSLPDRPLELGTLAESCFHDRERHLQKLE